MWVTDPICLGELINWKPTSFTNEGEEGKNTYSSGILQMELSCCHLFETTRITRKTKQTYKLNSTCLSMMLTQVSLHLERRCNGITGTQKRKVSSWGQKVYFIYPVNYLILTSSVLSYLFTWVWKSLCFTSRWVCF